MRIDSHQHFWNYSLEEYDWIDDSMSVLRRDFLPPHLKEEFDQHQVDASVAVQARCTLEETRWLLDFTKQYKHVAGVVGWIDLKDDKLAEVLEEFKDEKTLCGFREILQGQEPEFMLDPNFIRGLKLLAEKGYSYDILVFPKHLKAVKQLLEELPEMRLVIDHIAKPLIGEGQIDEWAEDINEVAKYPHVYCKLSGMVTETKPGWDSADFDPYMSVIFNAFGEDRIMYGSDWPVCLLSGTYSEVHNLALDFTKKHSATAEAKVFGANAAKFYQL
ncbi:amidohydrolase family protein [Lentisphaera profundi]|uniref:Amidohydrolase family protein n=1 Tax=Lentisphaera profundi TaxID=1658616 RepID=A0ABY7VRZ3_9BACT|nr:amidohydrolase family protein [Lentisphaera profundi]WDE96975.1 amidohydrolase family protein [Lentisphaera profundi]